MINKGPVKSARTTLRVPPFYLTFKTGPNVFEALISSGIIFKILVPKFTIDSVLKQTVRIFTLRKSLPLRSS